MQAKFRRVQAREVIVITAVLLALMAAVVGLVLRFSDPAPPSRFVISAATKGSPYHSFALRYADLFEKNRVHLDVRESGGSMANLEALRTQDAGAAADAGFVQGGLVDPKDATGLLSIGRIAYEPLWVFHNLDKKLERLAELKGRRVLVGPEGGGTNRLALKLLAANGITADNTTLITRELPDYVDLLGKGGADAGFLVLAPEARTIQRLLRTPDVHLMSFTNADAYTQRFPFLTKLELREGVVDLGNGIPRADTVLLATTAALVVRETAHPALVNLLAQAVQQAHARPTAGANGETPLFVRAGEFPTSVDPEFAMSDDARRLYRSGPPMLQRYVRFWLATLIDRLMVSMLVVLPLAIPIARFAPQIYRWRVRRRILRWYGALKALEARITPDTTPAERLAAVGELDRIAASVDNIPVPLGFADQFYDLRQHIEGVRERLGGAARRAREFRASPSLT